MNLELKNSFKEDWVKKNNKKKTGVLVADNQELYYERTVNSTKLPAKRGK